ncbi:MAG: hypothetical protein ACR2QM_05035 [Longimicrobiales bacterium]
MSNTDRTRRERKINDLLQSESRWLQKVRFALMQAQNARKGLAEVRGNAPEPIQLGQNSIKLEKLSEALEARVATLSESLQERRAKLAR